MSTMRERIAALEAERSEIIAHNWTLQETVDELSRACDNLQTTVNDDMRYLTEAATWRDRASAAEDELSALRTALRAYVVELRDVTRGGVVGYRRDSADRLVQILDA